MTDLFARNIMSKPIFPDEITWSLEFLKEMKNFKFNPDNYYKQFFCEWEVDQRTIDLQDTLYKFYNDYEEVDNRMYIKAWRKLDDKLLRQGYSREEIIQAKKEVRTWRLKGE